MQSFVKKEKTRTCRGFWDKMSGLRCGYMWNFFVDVIDDDFTLTYMHVKRHTVDLQQMSSRMCKASRDFADRGEQFVKAVVRIPGL